MLLIHCDELFLFCNTSPILTSVARAAEGQGMHMEQDAGSLAGTLGPGWLRAVA